VLAASFVIKELLPAELAALPDMPAAHMRDITAVISVRALSCLYFPEAPWSHKLLALFTVPALEYPFGSGLPDACHQERGPPKPYKDLVKLFVHAYDCCVDYNPPKVPSRAVIAFDHISLTTTISPILSSAMQLQLELRDGYAYLLDKSTKIGHSTVTPPSTIMYHHRCTIAALLQYSCDTIVIIMYSSHYCDRMQASAATHKPPASRTKAGSPLCPPRTCTTSRAPPSCCTSKISALRACSGQTLL
jgi:hypothetical protein